MVLSIQYLRAVAVLMVVAVHLAIKLPLTGTQRGYVLIGAVGVDIFFVISGFVMYLTTFEKRMTALAFYEKRIIRIVPCYYAVTVLVILLVLAFPMAANITTLSVDHVIASLAFIPWPHPGWPNKLWPLVVPGWTLNYEMFFYFLVGLTLLLRESLRPAALSAAIVTLVAIGLAAETGAIGRFYTSPLLLEFLAGFWLGHLYCKGARLPGWSGLVAIVGSAALLVMVGPEEESKGWDRILSWGILSYCLVAGAVFFERERPLRNVKLLHLVGDASYSIYLIQFIAVPGFVVAWRAVHLPINVGWLYVPFLIGGMAVVAAVGIGFYMFVEKPLIAAFQYVVNKQKKSRMRPIGGASRIDVEPAE